MNLFKTTIKVVITILIIFNTNIIAQKKNNSVVLDISKARYKIDKNIYGHFSEHLGKCIYEGFWVGEDSKIPNIRGLRLDVIHALKNINVPLLRWPGGCFADEYHWKDGIGPRSERPTMINTNWGGVTEDNSFGTHEFLDLCEQIGCEPFFSGNMGSGTVQELSQWVEYTNSDNVSPMTKLRKENGRDKSWGVTYWGLGNETWGCGGNMNPLYYANEAKQFSTFMKNFGDNKIKKIAVGASGSDYNWTDVVMKEMGTSMWGLSLHYYTWANTMQATDVNVDNWYGILKKTLFIDELISEHSRIMNKYDPGKSVALAVDEWGTWYKVEEGTNPGFLYQQNTLRDALVAAINLNIFNNHADRVRMAAIAQVVNVLQAVILTKEEKMILTPTYHVFDMYKVHQNSVLVPTKLTTDSISVKGENIPSLNISSSLDKEGNINLTICNLSATENKKLECLLSDYVVESVEGKILTSTEISGHNTFEYPENVGVKSFGEFKNTSKGIDIKIPKHSVVALKLTGKVKTKKAKINYDKLKSGLIYNYYEGAFDRLPYFSELTANRSGKIDNIEYPSNLPENNFGLTYSGFIKIEKDGLYEFFLSSDDGSSLKINDDQIIINDGLHGMKEVSSSIFLKEGYSPFEIAFFQKGGGSGLEFMMKAPNKEKELVPADLLFHIRK